MRRLSRTLNLAGGLLWLLALLAASCARSDRLSLGAETNDPQYRRGQQFLKQGRSQEALGAFLKVIEERGDDAPESHLEAGLLYQQHFKDPLSAIYHFRKYLEVLPNSRQADLVRQRIDAAMRDFARSLPGQPLENQTARFELLGKIDQLQQENQQLKDELAALGQGGGAVPASRTSAAATPVSRAPAGPPPASIVSGPMTVRLMPFNSSPASPAGATVRAGPPARQPATTPASPPPAAAGRRHVVAPGDTLYKIAQRYYGSGAKWPEILEANRDQLKSESSVRAGMELRIP
jgi:tetratricopeptide (TPR) repeat protein